MSFIISLLVTALIVFALANILPGVSIKNYGSAIILSIVLGILNAVIAPILHFFSFPIKLLTLGLFSFVITAVIILIASGIMGDRFKVNSFFHALIFGVVLAIVNSITNGLFF